MEGNHVLSAPKASCLRNVICRGDKSRKQEDHVKQGKARKVGWADHA